MCLNLVLLWLATKWNLHLNHRQELNVLSERQLLNWKKGRISILGVIISPFCHEI